MKKNTNDTINVLMVGSAINVKGGMTTVVKSFINHNFNKNNVNLKYIPTHIEAKNVLIKLVYFIRQLLCILYYLICKRIDIVHIHMSENGSFRRKYIIFTLSKKLNKCVVTHLHGAEFDSYYDNAKKRTKKQVRNLLGKSDLVITLGERWNQIINRIEPKSKKYILRNAVKIPDIQNKLKLRNINLVFLAVVIKRKGILDLVHASKGVISKLSAMGIKCKIIVGGDGELLPTIKDMVEESGIQENYEFLGWVDGDLKTSLLKKTDVLVLPSYNEGLPLSIIEAMSYGIPIITTDVGSINEAVKDNINGFLINPGDQEALEEKIIQLISDSSKYIKMGEMSKKIARDNFNIDIYFENLCEQYRLLILKK
ncbi:glycosyltransferase family 4 protein [Niallia alba]|uniref:glycosyltransferase family 4 protein n=1 Tax=Niallia alba TaxID=2729105 RepID=UPI00399EFF46